jgi:hypothetical protein
MLQSNGADRHLPADCEVRHAAEEYAGVAADGTEVSLQRCLFANNPSIGVSSRETGSVRVEGCEFVDNGYNIRVWTDSVLYTDNLALANSMGCHDCDSTEEYGPVRPLSDVPTSTKFLADTDPDFVALQLVRPS